VGSDIDTIRKGFAAWSRGDLDGAIVHLDPGLEFLTSGLYPGLDPVYRGHDGFAKFFSEFRGAWEDVSLEVEQIVEATPRLFVVVGHFLATARDGLLVERPVGVVVTTSDGTITRMQSYPSREEALEAAGLPPRGRPPRGSPSGRPATR
jgi:ketosteroid isomerase-like protein